MPLKAGGDQTENNLVKDSQIRHTQGGKTEHNFLVLQYSIEDTYRMKRPLITTVVEYRKPFNSIKREELIRTLIKYKVNHKIKGAVANICHNYNTRKKKKKKTKKTLQSTSQMEFIKDVLDQLPYSN